MSNFTFFYILKLELWFQNEQKESSQFRQNGSYFSVFFLRTLASKVFFIPSTSTSKKKFIKSGLSRGKSTWINFLKWNYKDNFLPSRKNCKLGFQIFPIRIFSKIFSGKKLQKKNSSLLLTNKNRIFKTFLSLKKKFQIIFWTDSGLSIFLQNFRHCWISFQKIRDILIFGRYLLNLSIFYSISITLKEWDIQVCNPSWKMILERNLSNTSKSWRGIFFFSKTFPKNSGQNSQKIFLKKIFNFFKIVSQWKG